MKILIMYFSPTGNTRRCAEAIRYRFEELSVDVDLMDITPLSSRSGPVSLEGYDAVVFGAPIHSWRAPRVVREWLSTLDGCGKRCAMFFTYGGFGVHPTHHSTRRILEDRNFTVVSSADFLGAHTFNLGGWRAMENRPDETDFSLAREFAEKTYRRFTGEDPGLPGPFEKTKHTDDALDSIESFRFKALTRLPTREGRTCSLCMACEDICPSGAMNAADGEADREKCIACLACVAACPEKALVINDMKGIWDIKLQMEKIKEEDLRLKRGVLYF
jgi:ferredoxin